MFLVIKFLIAAMLLYSGAELLKTGYFIFERGRSSFTSMFLIGGLGMIYLSLLPWLPEKVKAWLDWK